MSSNLLSLFASHKPLKPQFKVVQTNPEDRKKESSRDKQEKQAQSVISARENSSSPKKKREPDPRERRTVFVGNISLACSKKQIKLLFRQHGTVESVRFRSMAIAPGKLPTFVARKTHKQLSGSSLNAYVVFSSEEEAERSLALNGTLLEDRHLRVDLSVRSMEHEHQRSVFVGNLPFTADEEELRRVFSDCGEIEAVRIVRDTKLGVGKGFGFVQFKERSGVVFALKRNNKVELEGRPLRVIRSREMKTARGQKPLSFAGQQTKKLGRGKERRRQGRTKMKSKYVSQIKSKSNSTTLQGGGDKKRHRKGFKA